MLELSVSIVMQIRFSFSKKRIDYVKYYFCTKSEQILLRHVEVVLIIVIFRYFPKFPIFVHLST